MKTPIEILLDKVEYKLLPAPKEITNVPYATHEGILTIGGIELRVYVLNDGRRVIEQNDLIRFFGGESHD